jgi:sigma-B regulation protein RsbU (phosphoserine phosphatase)
MSDIPLKILSVDDEPDLSLLIKQMFRKEIKNGEFEFYFASNGAEALEVLASKKDINIVLADINMPVMNGLTLLKHIREQNNPLIRVIMVSAYGDMKNIRIAMNNGAFDFVTKPIDFSDLKATVIKAGEEINYLQRKIEQSKRLESLEADIEAGALIQAALLPKIKGRPDCCPNVNIFTHYDPAKEVSGDFYDVFPLDNHKLGFLIADVSGKGIPAAAFMLICHTAIRVYSREDLSPAGILQKTNDFVNIDNRESMFVTAFFALLNTKTGELSYAFAGHNKPYIITGKEVRQVDGNQNIALGIVENFDYRQESVMLNDGDKLFLFTDGITEPVNENGEEFGEERLTEIIKRNIESNVIDTGEKIIRSIEDFTHGLPQFDDITLIGFEYTANTD